MRNYKVYYVVARVVETYNPRHVLPTPQEINEFNAKFGWKFGWKAGKRELQTRHINKIMLCSIR